MPYNWEEIFKSMSSQELYKIYKGQTLKPREAIPFAEKELTRRGFDFDDMATNTKTWQLINAIKEVEIDAISNSDRSYMSWKIVVLILVGSIALFYFSGIYGNSPSEIAGLILLHISITVAIVFINNLLYKKQCNRRIKRQQKIERLREELREILKNSPNINLCQNDEISQKDIEIQQKEINSLQQFYRIILITSIILPLLLYRHC